MNRAVSWFIKIFLAPIVGWIFIKEIRGLDNIPHRNFIMASNHQSHLDLIANGYLCVPHVFKFVGQVDRYTGFQGFMRDLVYFISDTIPMDRREKESKNWAMNEAKECLLKGETIVVYPEGTRTRTGVMNKGKKGVGWLMAETQMPVLPVAISGTYELLPTGGQLKWEKKIKINIGKPLYFSELADRARLSEAGSKENLDALQEISDRIMAEIARLKQELEN